MYSHEIKVQLKHQTAWLDIIITSRRFSTKLANRMKKKSDATDVGEKSAAAATPDGKWRRSRKVGK